MIAPKEITDERIGGARNLPHEIHRELARIRDTLAARAATYLRRRDMGRLSDGAHDILEQRHRSFCPRLPDSFARSAWCGVSAHRQFGAVVEPENVSEVFGLVAARSRTALRLDLFRDAGQ